MGALEDKGVLYSDKENKERILFETFFSGRHIKDKSFDKKFEQSINQEYQSIISSLEYAAEVGTTDEE